MQYSLTTQHLELSELDRQQLDEKLARLDKFITTPATVALVVRRDTHHRQGNIVTCTITVDMDRHRIHTERTASSVQDTFDEAIGALKQELVKHHDKHKRQR
jgi:ribosomal subunit interface protein